MDELLIRRNSIIAAKVSSMKPINVVSPNIWDEVWHVGRFNTTTGVNDNSTQVNNLNSIRSENYIPVSPGTDYCISEQGVTRVDYCWVLFFDSNKSVVSGLTTAQTGGRATSGNAFNYSCGGIIKVPDGISYIRFYRPVLGGTYNHDICINESSSFNGKYMPYGVASINGLETLKMQAKWNQLVENGNFASDTKWAVYRGTKSISSNKLLYTKTEASGAGLIFQQTCKATQGHKVLIAATVKCSLNATINPCFYSGTDSGYNYSVSANTETRVSGIATITANGANGYLRIYTGALETGATVTIENVIVIDLTDFFGAGNEPSLDVCKILLPLDYYPHNSGTILTDFLSMLRYNGLRVGWMTNPSELNNNKGAVAMEYKEFDMGGLTYTYNSSYATPVLTSTGLIGAGGNYNAVCPKYTFKQATWANPTSINVAQAKLSDKEFTVLQNGTLVVKDYAYTDAATFKTAMAGVSIIFELATPIGYELVDE